MGNSYSYLGFSGLTLINVIRAVAPRGAPPDESCPIKFQSSLWTGLCQRLREPEGGGGGKERERAGWPWRTGALGLTLASAPAAEAWAAGALLLTQRIRFCSPHSCPLSSPSGWYKPARGCLAAPSRGLGGTGPLAGGKELGTLIWRDRSQGCSLQSNRAQCAVGNGIWTLHPARWRPERRGGSQTQVCWRGEGRGGKGPALSRFGVSWQEVLGRPLQPPATGLGLHGPHHRTEHWDTGQLGSQASGDRRKETLGYLTPCCTHVLWRRDFPGPGKRPGQSPAPG